MGGSISPNSFNFSYNHCYFSWLLDVEPGALKLTKVCLNHDRGWRWVSAQPGSASSQCTRATKCDRTQPTRRRVRQRHMQYSGFLQQFWGELWQDPSGRDRREVELQSQPSENFHTFLCELFQPKIFFPSYFKSNILRISYKLSAYYFKS